MKHQHPFDTPTFYLTDPSFRYSTNELKRLVGAGIIDPDTVAKTTGGQAFPVELIIAVNSTAEFPAVKFPSEPPHLRHTRRVGLVESKHLSY